MGTSDPDSRLAYRDMLRVARRLTSSEADARDLVQDALGVALERGMKDWSSPRHRAWLHGVLRKRAAFVARTAARRRRRERMTPMESAPHTGWAWRPDFLSALPPSLRAVASLAGADLSGKEIRWLLGLSGTAFRTRLCALGRRVRREEELPVEAPASVVEPLGPRRATVLAQLGKLPSRTMATHDPDGHILFFRSGAHKDGADGNE